MANIPAERKLIQSEETNYAAAVSSSVAKRIGAGINFINLFQHTDRSWILNGPYGVSTGSQTGVDGTIAIWRDMEIVGFFMFNQVAGTSGTTEVMIRRHTASNQAGSSLFSVTPLILEVAGDNAFMSVWYDPLEVLESSEAVRLPTFATRLLDKGDALSLDFVQRQSGAESLTITLALRPR